MKPSLLSGSSYHHPAPTRPCPELFPPSCCPSRETSPALTSHILLTQPPCLSSLKETCHQHIESPLANHCPSHGRLSTPSAPPPPTHQPVCFIHPHANSTYTVPERTSSLPHTGHTAAAEGHIHVASRASSCRSFCQGHLLHQTWRNYTHPVKPKSGITSSEKPSRTSPAESPVPALLPWYLGEGPKATPQPLCPFPTPTPFDQVLLDLALLTGIELVPSGPSNSPEEAQPWWSRSFE